MLDLLITNARLPRATDLASVAIQGDRIVAPPSGEPPAADQVIDACGNLLTPALVEPHIHLDAVLTVGQPRHNLSGSLFEGIAIWGERIKDLTVDDVKHRVGQVLRWQVANGVLFVRSHVDVCDPKLTALRALLEVRQEFADQITLQLVAFPQQGIQSFPDGEALMRKAVELGADVVGGIPHFELTREYGERSVKFAVALAHEFNKLVDIHCDETDDEHSRFLEVLAAETIRLKMQGRVTASHTTAMHSYNNAYAGRLIVNVHRAGLNMVTNPLDNAVLQGRFDHYPIRRGHTRVKELLAAGVNVCLGHDSVMDPWYPLGKADPLQAAFTLAHYGQMSGFEEIRTMIDMITVNGARALGLTDYGLEPGCRADLVLFDAPTESDAIRLMAPRRLVIHGGKVVARTEPARHVVAWKGRDEPVDFMPNRPG
ncbi:MAG: cytosine deaminase [Candidatus Dormibacteraeota bacterium]|nr:cytosine deaminase [Candidatus Dormibacteraeota bacterium]